MAAEEIIGIKDGKFVFDEHKLSQILKKVPADTEIGVISIAGEFRKGKSFLLNFFLQYLQHRINYSSRQFGADKLPPWLKDVEKSQGFKFMAGRNRETTGIIVWNEPFLIQMKNEKELAVLLIDSQGLYDQQTSANDNVRLFTMVSMMSSTLMVNTPQQINSKQLSELRYFLNYAATSISIGSNSKLLQTLLFVVRDYENAEQLGYEAGQDLIDGFFKETTVNDIKETSGALKKGFKKISAFCLPHPGKRVIKSDFNGKLNEIDQDFLFNMAHLISSVVDDLEPRNLVYNLSTSDFVNHIQSIVKNFNEGLTPFEIVRLQQGKALQAIGDKIDRTVSTYTDQLVKNLEAKAESLQTSQYSDSQLREVIENVNLHTVEQILQEASSIIPNDFVLQIGDTQSDRKKAGELLREKITQRYQEILPQLLNQAKTKQRQRQLELEVLRKTEETEREKQKIIAQAEENRRLVEQMNLSRAETEMRLIEIQKDTRNQMDILMKANESVVNALKDELHEVQIREQNNREAWMKEMEKQEKRSREHRDAMMRTYEKTVNGLRDQIKDLANRPPPPPVVIRESKPCCIS